MLPLIAKHCSDLKESKLHGVVLACDIMMDDVVAE